MDNVEIARNYFEAASRSVIAEVESYFAPEVVQIEYPNRLVASGATRDLNALHEGALRGQKVMTEQHYDVEQIFGSGDMVVAEVLWRGKLAVPFGTLAVGDEMRAHCAMVLQFRDGKIISQHNYDCFEPF